MTLPASGSISLWGIASEFGLAQTAVFPTAFYGKGGAPASGALSFSNFYGRSGLSVTVHGGSYNKSAGTGSATASYLLSSDGTERDQDNINVGTWISNPASRGSYWVRATLVSGSAPTSGTLNAWTNLSTSQGWGITQIGNGEKSCSLNIQVASDSGGSSIVSSATLDLHASVGLI